MNKQLLTKSNKEMKGINDSLEQLSISKSQRNPEVPTKVSKFDLGRVEHVSRTAAGKENKGKFNEFSTKSVKDKEPNKVSQFTYVPQLFSHKDVKKVTGGIGWSFLSPGTKKRVNDQLQNKSISGLGMGIQVTNNNFYGNIDKV